MFYIIKIPKFTIPKHKIAILTPMLAMGEGRSKTHLTVNLYKYAKTFGAYWCIWQQINGKNCYLM